MNPQATGKRDETQLGLFHIKSGKDPKSIFPAGLSKNYCGHFIAQGYKCPNDSASCANGRHVGRAKAMPLEDFKKILANISQTKDAWVDEETITRQRFNAYPGNMKHLLGNASGPSST